MAKKQFSISIEQDMFDLIVAYKYYTSRSFNGVVNEALKSYFARILNDNVFLDYMRILGLSNTEIEELLRKYAVLIV